VAAYVEQRFPVQALPVRLPQVLHQRTGGNPLFLVSLVEDLVAHEQVIECEGRWSLQGEVETLVLSVPDNIRHLVARQRERLSLLEQHLLAAASAAGLEFSVASVAAALAADTVEIDEHCHRLTEQRQFLRPAGIHEWPDGTRAGRYAFIHALYQQLWHEQAVVGRVQQWHRRIGERKEAAYGERTPEIAVELAVHFEQAGDWQRAAHYCEQVAQKALRRFAPHEAIAALHKRI
jgi:predicted ATPase